MPAELSVTAGDVVWVGALPVDGWIEARNLRTSQLGILAPSTLFRPGRAKPVESPHGAHQVHPSEIAGTEPKVQARATKLDVVRYAWWAGSRYFAQRGHEVDDSITDEMSVAPGDIMEIHDVVGENWLQGRNFTTSMVGLFPTSVLFSFDGDTEAVMALE
ncbi:hypothetical protein M427DRAFT_31155 [Gonapodya prolifera JEL478]|uniref:SH3 domain-containing protein n=1 Tax=Gonapodya prolifera (strain JEL478) TaxID=1344416 RepID=A0A139AHX1_GONPJ|nr:hypothetical protein M427DRAFT_31155 [Gonapodya prolifera JEL478]|eukprot:KXS16422.1 hypothetical protein M427DRAFT_31155 [Gonapodya prolifera JEL478]